MSKDPGENIWGLLEMRLHEAATRLQASHEGTIGVTKQD